MSMQSLDFIVSLIDRVSGPSGKIMGQIDKMTNNFRSLDVVNTRYQKGMTNIGFGAAGIYGLNAALHGATDKAIAFESSMAGIKKVVDFPNPVAFKEFGNDLLKMSRYIPITANGLADIAAAGGEQGVQFQDLLKYVDDVAKMSTAFDISPALAGDSIGKLANIYQIPIGQISNLGDVINHLSNNTNAKAAAMIDVLGRVGGISTAIGLTATQTSALSAAMLSLGQAPEVAGTAINALLLKLGTARNQGNDFIQGLASIGLSVKGLENNFKGGAQQAITDFLMRISSLEKHSQMLVLGKLFGQEYSDNLAGLVGNMGLYERILGMVANKSQYAGSMQTEFLIKALTTANMLQLLSNNWDNLMINTGSIFLPKIVEWVGKMNNVMGNVSDTVMRWTSLFPYLASGLADVAGWIFGIVGGLSALAVLSGIGTILGAGFALLTSPLMLTLGAIAALGYGIYKLIEYWPQIRIAAKDAIESVIKYVTDLGDRLAQIPGYIADVTMNAITAIYDGIAGIGRGIMEMFGSAIDWVIQKFALLTQFVGGVSFGNISLPSINKPAPINPVNTAGGGLLRQISNTNNQSNSKQIGPVTIINQESRKSLHELFDEVMMAGG